MVRVTSTVIHSVTCGIVNADSTIAWRHHLADALDRLAPVLQHVGRAGASLPSGGRRVGLSGHRAAGGRLDVLRGDDAARPGRGHRREVDAELAGELADRRLGEHPADRPGAGRLAVLEPRLPRAARPAPAPRRPGRPRRCRRRRARTSPAPASGSPSRRRSSRSPGRGGRGACAAPGLRPVADERRVLAARRGRVGEVHLGRRTRLRGSHGSAAGRTRRPCRRRPR